MIIKKILCPIDFSDFNQAANEYASTFAKSCGARIVYLYVSQPDVGYNSYDYVNVDRNLDDAWPAYVGSPDIMIQDNRLLQGIDTEVDDVTVRRHQLSGVPSERILEFINRNQPRLVVLGTHGRRGLGRLFGSVAVKILRNVDCPVLLLRQRQHSRDVVIPRYP